MNSIATTKSIPVELTVAPSGAYTDRVKRAKSYYAAIKDSADRMGAYGFLFGAELLALKESPMGEHGQWLKFTAENFPDIPHRTITWFMDATSKLAAAANLPTVGNIKLLSDGSLPKPVEKQILTAWHDVADGKSVTEFLRAIGAIREKQPHQHHPIKPLSPDEKIAAENAQADSLLCQASNALMLISNDLAGKHGILSTRIPTKRWKEFLRTCVSVTKAIRPLTKRKQSPAEKKESLAQKKWDKLAAKSRTACLTGGSLLADGPIKPHPSQKSHSALTQPATA